MPRTERLPCNTHVDITRAAVARRRAEAYELAVVGMTEDQAAKRLGVTVQTFRRYLRREQAIRAAVRKRDKGQAQRPRRHHRRGRDRAAARRRPYNQDDPAR